MKDGKLRTFFLLLPTIILILGIIVGVILGIIYDIAPLIGIGGGILLAGFIYWLIYGLAEVLDQ